MKTYDAETFVGARAAWEQGGFGSRWDEVRRISWEQGYPYPPTGSSADDREESPSQRSIVYASLDDRPSGTLRIVATSSSWAQVVARIIGTEAELRGRVEASEQAAERAKALWPSQGESIAVLASLGQRVGVR